MLEALLIGRGLVCVKGVGVSSFGAESGENFVWD